MITMTPKLIAVPPKNVFRRFCFRIVKDNQKFEIFILVIIALNTVTLMIPYDGASEMFTLILSDLNAVFVGIFVLEAVIKLLGYGFRYYWHETWNKFDFIIIIISLVSQYSSLDTVNFTAFRIIRVARLLRMVKASKGLRNLLKTLYLALENIGNVAALLLLIIFTFAVAGMDIFGEMPQTDNITYNANFETFYLAMMLLIRASTGENWNSVMIDCYSNNGIIAIFYWVVFIILT